MIIVGAGLSGLIAASMMRDACSGIYEQQDSLPNNHSALLRFKTSVVGDAVGIPFRKVKVMKAIKDPSNPVQDAINYSTKVTGRPAIRSITTANGQIEDRYISPDDMISRLGAQAEGKVHFGKSMVDAINDAGGKKIISTIPMPALMDILGWKEKPEFNSRPGWTITVDCKDTDVCATLYYPQPHKTQYRASVTGSKIIVEGVDNIDTVKQNAGVVLNGCSYDLGLIHRVDNSTRVFKEQKYAKISAIDESLRKRFIMWASEVHGIYSLGRFATWRPGLLLDDIVNDVRVIQRIAHNPGETYAHKMKG